MWKPPCYIQSRQILTIELPPEKDGLKYIVSLHYVKSVQIWSLFWSVFSCIRTEYGYFPVFSPNRGKYGPEKTPHMDTFHAIFVTAFLVKFSFHKPQPSVISSSSHDP